MYPQADHVQFVENGYDDLVVIIDETYALRFPRHAGALARSQFERDILQDLEHHDFGAVAVPRLLGSHENPRYLITSFVPGQTLTPAFIRRLPRPAQQTLAEDIAQFTFELHNALSVDRVKQIRERFGLEGQEEDPWEVYFERLLLRAVLPTRQQDAVAKEYYERWSQIVPTAKQIMLHDDLHTENMLFKGNRLSGVLDFGDTNIGSPEQELRQLYRINDAITVWAAKAYGKLSGQDLDPNIIRIWAITQELSTYSERLQAGSTDHPAFHTPAAPPAAPVSACMSRASW
ncbi:MAG TPA: aminoglycoside phosphotransferase family protein, partial [Candidatus Saccharimonadia bacterium]